MKESIRRQAHHCGVDGYHVTKSKLVRPVGLDTFYPMNNRPVVYLSAHGRDLASATSSVRDALKLQGIDVLEESKPVRTKAQCRQHYGAALRCCDTVVQLVGLDPGPALTTEDDGDGPWSLGTWVAHEARKLRKPVQTILLADDFPFGNWTPPPASSVAVRKQGAYRRKLSSLHPPSEQVHDEDDLIEKLLSKMANGRPAEDEVKPGQPLELETVTTTPAEQSQVTVEEVSPEVPAPPSIFVLDEEDRVCDAAVEDSVGPEMPRVSELLPSQILISGFALRSPLPMKMEFSRVTPRSRKSSENTSWRPSHKGLKTLAGSTTPLTEPVVFEGSSDETDPCLPAPVKDHFFWPSELPERHPQRRANSFWIHDAGTGSHGAEITANMRVTFGFVAASVCVSFLLVGHAAWQHYSYNAPKVSALEEDVWGTPPESKPDLATKALSRLDRSPAVMAVAAAPASLAKPAVPEIVAEQIVIPSGLTSMELQAELKAELESAVMGARANPTGTLSHNDNHARELRSLQRRFQGLKMRVGAIVPAHHPRVLDLSRGLATAHLLFQEFQAAKNLLLDSRDTASHVFGERHEEVRLLDHMLGLTEALRNAAPTTPPDDAASQAMTDGSNKVEARHEHASPLSPGEMDTLLERLKSEPDFMPSSSYPVVAGQR